MSAKESATGSAKGSAKGQATAATAFAATAAAAKQDGGQDREQQASAASAASAWSHMVGEMKRASTQVDWSKIDLARLTPKDIGVHMGPMMTEEQFKAYRARAGPGSVHVVKAPNK